MRHQNVQAVIDLANEAVERFHGEKETFGGAEGKTTAWRWKLGNEYHEAWYSYDQGSVSYQILGVRRISVSHEGVLRIEA